MSKPKKNLPELLAPAGNIDCAVAAFDSGADAVYAGLQKFNARERTENFSFDEMSKLASYARKINRKFYITLNTLIKEGEIEEFARTVCDVASLRPDAVIVQDLAAVRIIREYFPSLTIHASTQMGIHNSAGIMTAQQLGIKRVILERQLTLSEIKTIIGTSPLETEIFINGALCCSLSGCCLFSSWLGGWSGNRGKCKQPCRRRYFSSFGNGFFFSPKDLCTLDLVPEFKRTGVDSLKIEGRLRKPDYVENTVKAYRMMLDAPEGEEKAYLKKARNILSSSYGRKWSHGFYSADSAAELIEHKSMGVSGLLCGKVSAVSAKGFEVKLSRPLKINDRIRIQPPSGDEGPSITITKLSDGKANVSKAGKDKKCFVFCDKEIPSDGLVYKTGEGSTKRRKLTVLSDGLPALTVDLEIFLDDSGLEVKARTAGEVKIWHGNFSPENALKHSLTGETLADEFRHSATEKLEADKIKTEIKGEFFIPASVLKKLRREFWEWALENIDLSRSGFGKGLERFMNDYRRMHRNPCETERTFLVSKNAKASKKGIIAGKLSDFYEGTEELILPFFCPESKIKELEKKIEKAYSSGIRRFRVTSLYGISLLRKYSDIKLCSSFPLPVCSSVAAEELRKFGLEKVQIWPELERGSVKSFISKSPVATEICRSARIPLLVTRARVPAEGIIRDSRGNTFEIEKDGFSGLTFLFPEKNMSLPGQPGTSDFFECTASEKQGLSSFNWDYNLM